MFIYFPPGTTTAAVATTATPGRSPQAPALRFAAPRPGVCSADVSTTAGCAAPGACADLAAGCHVQRVYISRAAAAGPAGAPVAAVGIDAARLGGAAAAGGVRFALAGAVDCDAVSPCPQLGGAGEEFGTRGAGHGAGLPFSIDDVTGTLRTAAPLANMTGRVLHTVYVTATARVAGANTNLTATARVDVAVYELALARAASSAGEAVGATWHASAASLEVAIAATASLRGVLAARCGAAPAGGAAPSLAPCRVDVAGSGGRASVSVSLAALPDGAATAVVEVGAPGVPPVTFTQAVVRDTRAPAIAFAAGSGGDSAQPTTATTASVVVAAAAAEPGAGAAAVTSPLRLLCRMDLNLAADFEPCDVQEAAGGVYTIAVTGLLPGLRSLEVRPSDAAGNTGPPLVTRWVVWPPAAEGAGAQRIGLSGVSVPSLTFDTAARFEYFQTPGGSAPPGCVLDGAACTPAGGVVAASNLAPGRHTLALGDPGQPGGHVAVQWDVLDTAAASSVRIANPPAHGLVKYTRQRNWTARLDAATPPSHFKCRVGSSALTGWERCCTEAYGSESLCEAHCRSGGSLMAGDTCHGGATFAKCFSGVAQPDAAALPQSAWVLNDGSLDVYVHPPCFLPCGRVHARVPGRHTHRAAPRRAATLPPPPPPPPRWFFGRQCCVLTQAHGRVCLFGLYSRSRYGLPAAAAALGEAQATSSALSFVLTCIAVLASPGGSGPLLDTPPASWAWTVLPSEDTFGVGCPRATPCLVAVGRGRERH